MASSDDVFKELFASIYEPFFGLNEMDHELHGIYMDHKPEHEFVTVLDKCEQQSMKNKYIIHDPNTPWDKMEPKVGDMFESPAQLKFCIQNYGVSNGHQIYFEKCDKTRIVARCGKRTKMNDYPFRLKFKFGSFVSPQWIGRHYITETENTPKMTLTDMIADIKQRLRCIVNGELLTTIGRDANNQLYLIAWVVVDVESKPNWTWFIELLRDSLDLHDLKGSVVISDQHKPPKKKNMSKKESSSSKVLKESRSKKEATRYDESLRASQSSQPPKKKNKSKKEASSSKEGDGIQTGDHGNSIVIGEHGDGIQIGEGDGIDTGDHDDGIETGDHGDDIQTRDVIYVIIEDGHIVEEVEVIDVGKEDVLLKRVGLELYKVLDEVEQRVDEILGEGSFKQQSETYDATQSDYGGNVEFSE
ncbi:unnamed protein product [Lactuca saligna]|uniref:MULE transposase domain-containing protein n=1 Tax=Lactuca saligna TaxID=75948 RepID=A0AA35YK34_LACSI|nr:unnamed protein product [Lactuca saligna]